MIINLSEIIFENDFFSVSLPDGSSLVFNEINEELVTLDNKVIDIHNINIQKVITGSTGEEYIDCSVAIGSRNTILGIYTTYTEYESALLNSNNMKYCTMEVFE